MNNIKIKNTIYSIKKLDTYLHNHAILYEDANCYIYKTSNKHLNISICSIVNSESNISINWIRYYLELGIKKIFIYDDNERDLSNEISDYINNGLIEIINVHGYKKEKNIDLYDYCYINWMNNHYNEFDWVCYFDINDYLTITNGSLFEYLNSSCFDDIDTILLNIKRYLNNGTELSTNNRCKSIVRCSNKKIYISVDHILKYKFLYNDICVADSNGTNITNTVLYSNDSLQYTLYDNAYIKRYDNIKVALCAIAKNENLYIREWVEYYKNLGIDKIFLYDNNDLDGEHFEDVINDYIQDGFVEVIDKRGIEKGLVYDEQGINLQTACYIDCYENKVNDFDWVCFFDIDEFLNFRTNKNIKSFLEKNIFNDFDTIFVSWEHFDDNNLIYYDNRNVVDRFTHISKIRRYGVKSIARTNKTIENKKRRNLIHHFIFNDRNVCYADGTSIKITYNKQWYTIPKQQHDNCECVLNHYKTKTAEEYVKRHLGRHWGTTTEALNNKKNIYDCIIDYSRYNDLTQDKTNYILSYKETDLKLPKIAVCAIAKLENKYLREWVEYYKKQGVYKIFLYDNNDINGETFNEVIDDYIKSNFVKVINYRGIKCAQLKAYNHCYSCFGKYYDWIAFFDIDEFFETASGITMQELLSAAMYNKYNCIRVWWKNYTDNGLLKVENNNYSITRFTEVLDESFVNNGLNITDINTVNKETKAIIRGKIEKLNIDSPHGALNNNIINACGLLGNHVPNTLMQNNKNHIIGWLNHYRFKTIEEYVLTKMTRLWATDFKNGGKGYLDLNFFFKYNVYSNEKESIGNYLIKKYNLL